MIGNRFMVKLSLVGLLGVCWLISAGPALAIIANSQVVTASIADRAITVKKIANGAVKAAKISAGAVRTVHIANGAVTSAKIADESIIEDDIGDDAVGTLEIADGAVTADDIESDAVGSLEISDGVITDEDIADDAAISASKINAAGLDADTLDGIDSADFLRNTGAQTVNGPITATDFAYRAAKTGYLSIPPSAFNPLDSSTTYSGLGNDEIYATSAGNAFFQAPVYLPSGATVTNVRFQVWDNNVTYRFQGKMYYRRHSDGYLGLMANVDSTATSASWQDLDDGSIFNPVVDYQNNHYLVQVRLRGEAGTAIKAAGVVITYQASGP